MENITISKHLTDAQIREVYAEQLASGKPFITAIEESSPDAQGQQYVHIFVAQLGTDMSNASEADQMFLGWDLPIKRTHRNVVASRAKAMGLAPGFIFEQGHIVVTDSFEQRIYSDGRPQPHRIYGENDSQGRAGQPYLVQGRKVYRNTELYIGSNPPENTIFKAAPVPTTTVMGANTTAPIEDEGEVDFSDDFDI